MDTDDLSILMGFLCGVSCTMVAVMLTNDYGKSVCERNLLRKEQCEYVWVTPEQSKILKEIK